MPKNKRRNADVDAGGKPRSPWIRRAGFEEYIKRCDWSRIRAAAHAIGEDLFSLECSPDSWAEYCRACHDGDLPCTPEDYIRWHKVMQRLRSAPPEILISGLTSPVMAGVTWATGPFAYQGATGASAWATGFAGPAIVVASGAGVFVRPQQMRYPQADVTGLTSPAGPSDMPSCELCRLHGAPCWLCRALAETSLP